MRPSITEQLDGMCRVLEETVAPEVHSGHALEILRSLVSNVRMLSKNWHNVPGFLDWDNGATVELLFSARPDVCEALRRRIDAALAEAPLNQTDILAVDTFNQQLRQLTTECLADTLTPPVREKILQHLSDRTTRYPMRLSGATPKQTS